MTSLSRSNVSPSTKLLLRILERPGLVAAVRELPGAVLGKLIDRIGLEDAGELVALATTAQLERVFDDDLWRADRAGGDETFQPERFALWLRVMLEAGDDRLVQRLCELPQDLVALAVHRLVLVLDMDVLEEQLSPGDEEAEALERALETAVVEEWEEFRLIARDPDVWDDVWNALAVARSRSPRSVAGDPRAVLRDEHGVHLGPGRPLPGADGGRDARQRRRGGARRSAGRGRVHQPGGRAGVSRARAAGRRRRCARSDHARVFSRPARTEDRLRSEWRRARRARPMWTSWRRCCGRRT